MSQLTVTVLQLGLLVLLWLFVLGVVAVLRRDLFGARAATGPSSSPSSSPVASTPSAAPPQRAAAAPARPDPPRPEPARPEPPRQEAPRPARPRALVVVEGPLAGTRLDLRDEPVLLGRSPDCTLVLGDDYASGHHARLVPAASSPGGWLLEDLGSTNGTSLGRDGASARVSGSAPVGIGSTIRIGRTALELR